MGRLDAALAQPKTASVMTADVKIQQCQDEIVRLEAALVMLDKNKDEINDNIKELQNKKDKVLGLALVHKDLSAKKNLTSANRDIAIAREELQDIENAKEHANNQLILERQRCKILQQNIDSEKLNKLNNERLQLYREYDKVLDNVADYFVKFVDINKRLGDLDQSASGKDSPDYYKYNNDDTHIAILVRKLTPYLLKLHTFTKYETAIKDGSFHGSARAKEIQKYMFANQVDHDTALITLATTVWNDKLMPSQVIVPEPAEKVI